jgi:hypothetical protein
VNSFSCNYRKSVCHVNRTTGFVIVAIVAAIISAVVVVIVLVVIIDDDDDDGLASGCLLSSIH